MGFAGFKEDIEDLIAERMYMIGGWAATDFKVQSKSFKQPIKYKSKRLSCPICGTIVKKEDLNSHVKIYHENSFDVKINGRRMFDNVINIEKDRVEIICNPYSYKEFEIVFNPGNYIEKVFCETNKYKYDITDKIRRKYFKNLSIFYGNNRIELESKNLFDYEDITIKHIRTKKYTSKSVLKEIGKRSLEVEEKINILKIFIFEKNHVEDIMERFTNDIYDKSKTDELILRANMYFNEKKLKYDNFSLLTQSQWDVIYDIINCSIPKNIVKLNECSTMDYNIICILISAILNNNDLDTDLLESESNSSGILNNILNILLFYRKLDEKSYYGYLKARRKIEDDLDELSIYEDLPIVKLFYNIDYSIIHNISFEDNSLNLVMNISPFFALHQFNICEDESILIGGLNKFPHSIDLKKTAVKYHYPWAINYLTVNEIKKMNELKNSVEKNTVDCLLKIFQFLMTIQF